MKKFKEHVIYYYNSYWLALISIAYGWQLIAHPNILQTYRVYQKIRDVFDHRFIGVFFVALGALYAIATMLNLKKVKRVTLPIFSFIWTFFGFSFILSEPPNTVGILTLGVALLGFGISLRGDFKDG
ncbi:hypothetical protein ACUW9Z_001029 [Aerococcus sp. 150760007-1]|uniref:EamA domain-containing protein n=1 Tax=Aerococcus urinaeequi TaxID=51665 RepID=A0ABR5ZYB7_9LACT|nr:hypothetical protein [Aerococcus urinaeequi]MBA5746703.1 hypothetical protein [Aerococcus urinaeequi]MBA5829502.1 hypothetical protein [Aerococcus urinaeequi]MBA5860391.1 hypothetical protein [Aerococcus urinaeequi]